MPIVTPGVEPASKLVTGRSPKWLKAWAQFAKSAAYDALPNEVVSRTRLVVLDCLGAIIAGRGEPEVGLAEKRLKRSGRIGKRGSPLLTAFLDGTAGTMLEIDEGNQYARGHPGIHVVPAVLAAAQTKKVSGRQAIMAVALGYEIGARIGMASKLRVTMHPHGTWGTVGAAVSVAKVHRANANEMASVINVASSLGLTTSRRTMLEGGTVRNTYAGFSNMLGMMVWDLVKSGFTGESDGIGSVYGGIAADGFDPQIMTDALGTRWEIARNYFKQHAACRYNHGALDALGSIIAKAGGRLDAEMIEAIEVETYVWAAQLDHPEPANMLAAKFSMPFSLATYIVNGAASLNAFRDQARSMSGHSGSRQTHHHHRRPLDDREAAGSEAGAGSSAIEGRANARRGGTNEQGGYRGSLSQRMKSSPSSTRLPGRSSRPLGCVTSPGLFSLSMQSRTSLD